MLAVIFHFELVAIFIAIGGVMLDVFNCGQGDSLRLRFDNCYWDDNKPLYIDLGPSNYNKMVTEENIELLITHSHSDHISGMIIPHNVKINTLYIPAYYPEIWKIILHLTGRKLNLPSQHLGGIVLLYDKMNFPHCAHVDVLNPPLSPLDAFPDSENTSIDELNAFLDAFGTSVANIANEQFDLGDYSIPDGYQPENFIKIVVNKIKSYYRGNIATAINNYFKYDANKMSVVFSYSTTCCENKTDRNVLLLTGDADTSVFHRIAKDNKNRLKANVLKVPHHGSRNNLSSKILKYISPDVAIISHGNGLFGRATDPHPNCEVIALLNGNKKIRTYYTNDVVKDPKVTPANKLLTVVSQTAINTAILNNSTIIVSPRHRGVVPSFGVKIT